MADDAGLEEGGEAFEARRAMEIELAWQRREAHHMRGARGPWREEWHAMRSRLAEAQNHRCCWCGVRLGEGGKDNDPSFEHIIPQSRGGSDCEGNLAVSCHRCNNDRGDSMEWLTRLPDWDDSLLPPPDDGCPVDFGKARAEHKRLATAADTGNQDDLAQLRGYEMRYLRRFGQEAADADRQEWLAANN